MSGWLSRLFPSRPKVGPAQARDLQAQGAILLDVREDAEWRAGHAPKARHIPLRRLPARLREVPANRTVITACRSGHSPGDGRDVLNLAGGMRAWARAGLPVVASGGTPGRVA